MSSVYLALFVGTVVMGWVGSFYDQMSGAAFWTMDGAISLVGAALTLAVRRPLERALAVA